jgi:hypothetical protein
VDAKQVAILCLGEVGKADDAAAIAERDRLMREKYQFVTDGFTPEQLAYVVIAFGSSPATASIADQISIHTIDLPPRAPKQLLLDLKKIFETFPGKERIQLRIGGQIIPVPMTPTLIRFLLMRPPSAYRPRPFR